MNIKMATIAGTALGTAAGVGVMARDTDVKNLEAKDAAVIGGGVVAGGAGGAFASRWAGPQASYALAERALDKAHGRQKQVLMDLKTGNIMKYDQTKYLQESADIVNSARARIMSAAAPNKLFVLGSGAVGAALLGAGAAYGIKQLIDG